MGLQNRSITYVGKKRRSEQGVNYACFDYFFELQDHQSKTVCVGITEGWHDEIPALEKTLTDDDLVSIAKEFLEPQLATGWEPSPGKNRCEIPYGVMEHRVLNGSFF